MFGAVAASSRLLNLTREQMLMAYGIVGSRAGSLAINTGTMTKSSHAGHAARMGVECAVLANMGWTASADVFGPKGFFDTFMPGDSKPELLAENFGAPLHMLDPGRRLQGLPVQWFHAAPDRRRAATARAIPDPQRGHRTRRDRLPPL